MSFTEVSHVIFDLDGLLIDSEIGYNKIISDIARKYGKEYTRDIRMKILGTPEPETIRLAITEMQLGISTEEFQSQYREKIRTELTKPPLLEGAERLLHHLSKHKVPFALATSGSDEATETKLQNYKELFSMCHHQVRGSSDSEVKKGKPNPDIFLVCASRFPENPAPEKCVVFEDAPNGVTAAVAAGMQVVMVPTDDTSEELRKGATQILKSLNDFKPELFGLPAFD